MQGRQRIGPANGYRSNAMGIRGVAAPSQISPEGSMRGHRVYNTEHRNYNRGGYGRGGGRSRQFQQPPHPPRETDIFMEAGRLAAEYLVSKGVLPPTALSGKWHNDGWKNRVGNFQGFRPHEDVQIPLGGRGSPPPRLGSSNLDVGLGRRRYSDEYNSVASRNSFRGRRTGFFKDYGSQVNTEVGKSGSCAETSIASPGVEAVSDALASNHDEQPIGKDSNDGIQAPSPGEIIQEGDSATQLDSEEKDNSVENAGGKVSSSDEKYPTSDADEKTVEESGGDNKYQLETAERGNDNRLEQNQEEIKGVTVSTREDPLVSVDNVDLSNHCKFDKVPTEIRCEQDPTNEGENNADREFSEASGIHVADSVNDISAGNDSSFQNHQSKLESDVLPSPAVEKEQDATYSTMPVKCLRSGSFPERSVHKEEPDERLYGLGRSKSMLMERGEKRVMDDDIDCRESFKKLREWVPSMSIQSDGCLPLSSALENHSILHEQTTQNSPEQKSLSISLFPKCQAESAEFMQEKQLFPGSFKTCDLNLVGTSDVSENHDADSILFRPSVSETRKEVIPFDVDLSMSNNCNMPKRNGKRGINDTDIEVIDLENDSALEDQAFNNHERRGDAVFTDLVDGFPNNVHNANEIPGVQDGYGLMISEFFGNGSPNCSSVPTGLNSLHNDVGLPSEEGILVDDDSIYMSLEEIPISFLRGWDQPTQDYGKPF